jgi:SAM-dependent methyltransferase
MDVPSPAAVAATVGGDPGDAAALTLLPAAQWVASRTRGRPILDASRPAGLAARVLLEEGHEVVALVGTSSVAEALGFDLRGRALVEQADLADLPFESTVFGAVILEQASLAGRPADVILGEARRVLAPDGVLVVIGAPRSESGDLPTRELESVISRHFGHSAVVAQSDLLVSTVGGDDSEPDPAEYPRLPGYTRKEAFVAASDDPVQVAGPPTVFFNAIDVERLIRIWERSMRATVEAEGRAAAAERAAAGRDGLIKELYLSEQALAEAFDVRGRLESLVSNAAEQQRILADAREQLAAAHSEISRLVEANHDAHRQVLLLKSSTSWRITRPLRSLMGLAKAPPPGP